MSSSSTKNNKAAIISGFLLVMAIGSIFTLAGCKKGEDDPLISFRSRKARVEGKWTIKTGSVYLTYVNFQAGWRDNLMFDLKGATYFLTRTGYNGKPLTGTGADILNIEFTKNGNFSLTETLSAYQLDCTGNWEFNERSDGKKSKEYLELTINTYNKGNSKSTLFNLDQDVFTYRIKELRNKKMVIESYGGSYVDEVSNTHVTYKNEYTLVQE